MATYYPGSSGRRDVMPALHLKDTGHCLSPEPAFPGSMAYTNYSSANRYSESLGRPQSPQSCVEVPIADSLLSPVEGSRPDVLSNLAMAHLGNNIFNAWKDGRNEMLMQTRVTVTGMQGIDGQMDSSHDLSRNSMNTDIDMQMQLGILQGEQDLQLQQSDTSAVQGQGLSLSLRAQVPSAIPVSPCQYRHENPGVPFIGSQPSRLGSDPHSNDSSGSKHSCSDKYPAAFANGNDIMKGDLLNKLQSPCLSKPMHTYPSQYGFSNLANTVSNSKYLKAAQQLLEEVVNIRKALKPENNKNQSFQMPIGIAGSKEINAGINESENPSPTGVVQESTTGPSSELSPAERQDLQLKLTKLLSMLDEVDRRYRQYYHQMQIVVSSFDVVAGCGAAKTYTALALQTISRHFRCLQDAISGQVCASRRSLADQDASNDEGGGISRLHFVDRQLRQQRAMQQLVMVQQHAWRPQRGLPESSVSILRAWLFEHFLHPYPKDSDKLMLAQQTGLSRSQVSNWFINARVRLWKPMVEEMYKEEIGEIDLDSNSSSDNAAKESDSKRDFDERKSQDNRRVAAEKPQYSQINRSKSGPVLDSQMASKAALSGSHVVENSGNYRNLKFSGLSTDECNLLQDTLLHSDSSERLISFQMAGLGSSGNGSYTTKACTNNGVSLTLGLQNCDVGSLSVSSEQQKFMAIGTDDPYPTSISTSSSDYDYMKMGNRTQRFGPSHMLHDFVA